MDSVLDIFSGTLPINKGLNEGVNETSENKEIRNSEGVAYSEADLERIETAAGIMGEIFTDEVISDWDNLSVEERTGYLNEYYDKAGEALGIDTKGVYVADLFETYGYGTQGVNCGDGYLGIDIRLVADSSRLEELLDTTTHEMRHQLQTDALGNPDAFPDIPSETLDQWESEFNNYIDPSYDFEDYQNQAIEKDASAFAEEVVDEYLNDDTYSFAAHEADIPAAAAVNAEQVSGGRELKSTPADVQSDGLEVDKDLNRTTFSYTPGQCARSSTGTQNYCPFAGSGR